MATHLRHSEKDQFYFITFTCYKWLPLFDVSNIYEFFKVSFNHLHQRNIYVCGYVIMPNHMHMLVYDQSKKDSLNTAVAEMKRFLAYEIIKRLKAAHQDKLLTILKAGDAKPVEGEEITTILDYIHHNPVSKKWNLVDDFMMYPYSSAAFYEKEIKDPFGVLDYRPVCSEFSASNSER